MSSLETNTLSEIKFSDIKKILKRDKGIIGFKNFFKDYIHSILEKDNKEKFDENDFRLFSGYKENLKRYYQIVKNQFPYNDISLGFVKILVGGQTEKEFRDLCKIIKFKLPKNVKMSKIGEIFYFFFYVLGHHLKTNKHF